MTKPVVIEHHEGIDVAREDLFDSRLPSGKLRGLLPWFSSLADRQITTVINYAVSYSNSHAIVAFAAKETGLQAITLANCRNMNPQLQLAERYGARVIKTGPGHLSTLPGIARTYVKAHSLLLPWGLSHPSALVHIGRAAAAIITEYDMHVVPMGAGGYAYAVAWGLEMRGIREARVTAVPVSGSIATNLKRLRAIGTAVPLILAESPGKGPPPFPHDDHYESYAWPVAKQLRDEGKKVLFWNIGIPLCE